MKTDKSELVRLTYWALFVIAPTGFSVYLWGFGICLPVFFVLVLLGEHGFRQWKKLWKIDK